MTLLTRVTRALNNNHYAASDDLHNNKLAEIIGNKLGEVAQRKIRRPLSSIINDLQPSIRSLNEALSHGYTDFILECKKASPSKGLIRKDFDLQTILLEYRDFASAISILTDEKYFQGKLEYLEIASQQVTQPILCKDFFIDPYQVYEARSYGADAILLMLSVLSDQQYLELSALANQYAMDVLTEVHNEQELQRAIALDAKIIGINNRDLKTLKVDLRVTERLANKIPADRIIISESGISNRRDVQRLSPHVNAFLIGSSIMGEPDIRHHCKSLIFGNTKICGITQLSDAIHIDHCGATMAGFIFYQKSPRYLSLEAAKKIVQKVSLRYVGVFVDQPIEEIVFIAKQLKLYAVQLHGKESKNDVSQLKKELPGTQIWKALRVVNSVKFEQDPLVDRYLLDAYSPGQNGGSGKTFDWTLLKEIDTSEIIVAGGINSGNVEAAAKMASHAIDLSSGVEISPGIKCAKKLTAIFKQLRA